MSGHINLQTSWVLALLERAIIGSGVGKKQGKMEFYKDLFAKKKRSSLELLIEIPPKLFFCTYI